MPKLLPRCVMRAKDGSQCSRRVSDGSVPPVCHLHRGLNGGIALPEPFEPMSKLRKIAANDSHPRQVEAIKQILDREATDECPTCTATKNETTWLQYLTTEELKRHYDLTVELRTAALARQRRGEKPNRLLDFENDTLGPSKDQDDEANGKPDSGKVSAASGQRPAPAPAPDPDELIEVMGSKGPRMVRRGDLTEDNKI
jgi:hypothetical protein